MAKATATAKVVGVRQMYEVIDEHDLLNMQHMDDQVQLTSPFDIVHQHVSHRMNRLNVGNSMVWNEVHALMILYDDPHLNTNDSYRIR